MGTRRHGQEGALAPFWKCCKVFLCISSYSKTLSRRIIYALFSQPVVGFWGKVAQNPTGAVSLDAAGWLVPRPLICRPCKKSRGHPCPPIILQFNHCIPEQSHVEVSWRGAVMTVIYHYSYLYQNDWWFVWRWRWSIWGWFGEWHCANTGQAVTTQRGVWTGSFGTRRQCQNAAEVSDTFSQGPGRRTRSAVLWDAVHRQRARECNRPIQVCVLCITYLFW